MAHDRPDAENLQDGADLAGNDGGAIPRNLAAIELGAEKGIDAAGRQEEDGIPQDSAAHDAHVPSATIHLGQKDSAARSDQSNPLEGDGGEEEGQGPD
jgi:hypothetical protein